MEKNLGQEDIDALFAAADASARLKQKPDREPERYNFTRGGQISNDQMRAISTVNDLFARNLLQTFGGWLRVPVKVKLVSGEQLPFSEFLERISSLSYICSVRLEPLGAVGLLEMDLNLAAPIIEILLGGTGSVVSRRELTEIEEAILMSVMEVVVQELTLAWQPVGLEFLFEKRQTEAQAARLLTLGEKTLCVSFEVRMPEVQGVINVCLPAVVLNAILRRLITERDRPRRRTKGAAIRMKEIMGQAKFGTVLQFPPMRLRATELKALEAGTILRLPMPRYEPAELYVDGVRFAEAFPIRIGEHRGALLGGQTNAQGTTN